MCLKPITVPWVALSFDSFELRPSWGYFLDKNRISKNKKYIYPFILLRKQLTFFTMIFIFFEN